MYKLTLLTFLAVTPFAIDGCSGTSPTTPTALTTATSPLFSVQPSTLLAQAADHFSCPASPPFTVPFQLVVRTNDPALIVTNVTMRFVDSAGAPMPQVTLPAPPVTLPAPVPTTQFGTALTQARDLALSVGIGCGTGHTGTLTVIAETLDDHGHSGSAQLAVGVR
jgi:hypothetical protein